MYKTGVLAGKFTPPHRGHLSAIINASTKCEKLYVVISDHAKLTKMLCDKDNLPLMDLKLRAKWLSKELQGFDHIKVLMLDETNIPMYPYGWEQWSQMLIDLIPEKIDVLFGGELEYKEENDKYFPDAVYEIFDYKRERYPISATEIRANPLKHWDYILGSARHFFAKKVLIVGTESCGKTTMTKYLAKIYHTSWSEEAGRYYSTKYLGGNEDVFTIEDFEMIVYEQFQADMDALNKANKVVFYDTDALITQYYAEMYINQKSNLIEKFINPNRYDLVLFFAPDVKWVDDGFRWNEKNEVRYELHKKLKNMYIEHGFGDKIVDISGNYNERLQKCIKTIDKLLYV